ncbi:MAG: FAD-dependent oxidoreductase [Desulfobacteraceae bacterium]|nr:FAD-dependent oxidoreductase [Desulfobacteraceae bacterium]
MTGKKLLVVGGVAGGASCAARARRLSENADIIVFEMGPYVSFANCGLPYYVGNVITEEDDLLVATPEKFRDWFNIDVRINSEVTAIHREDREVSVRDLQTGRTYRESYDTLVLSPGSVAVKPPIPGIGMPGIFTVKDIPDTRVILDWMSRHRTRHCTVVGAGFIGLEMTENLKRRGLDVTVVEMQRQVMPAVDPEMADFVGEHMKAHGVELRLQAQVTEFTAGDKHRIAVRLNTGEIIDTDMVILAIGVRPQVQLAEAAGLAIGTTGGIVVDESMRTSDPFIWAVGDAVQARDRILGQECLVPLAGPANRQGRNAADAIMGGVASHRRFTGIQATSICGVFGMSLAATGLAEKKLKQLLESGCGLSYDKVFLHPDHHAAYYPDAKTITLKLLFETDSGRLLGAQALGMEGVDKRIDVIAMAIQKEGTVFDLEDAELCYAPQYGSAKDPVNLAGMVAANIVRKEVDNAHWQDLGNADPLILDVREPDEFDKGHVPGAVNIPLGQIRSRMSELPENVEIWAHCFVGKRSYYATRILSQNGFRVKNLSGGYLMHLAVNKPEGSGYN